MRRIKPKVEPRQQIKNARNVGKTKRKSKYRNVKIRIDGIRFDSKKEGKYYGIYKLQKQAGEIKDFELQPRFDFEIDGKHIFYYKADFKIFHNDGTEEIIDVKSAITKKNSTYRLKKKIIENVYGIEIVEK